MWTKPYHTNDCMQMIQGCNYLNDKSNSKDMNRCFQGKVYGWAKKEPVSCVSVFDLEGKSENSGDPRCVETG